MHAYIITGLSAHLRQERITSLIQEWNITPHDTVTLECAETSIGITQVREFQKRLLLKPYTSPFTVGVIHDMDTLTVEAQNALLKTLEEPPLHTRIIGETSQANALLPTILSRCTIVAAAPIEPALSSQEREDMKTFLRKLTSDPIGIRLIALDPYEKTREEAEAWTDKAIIALHDLLLASYDTQKSRAERLQIVAMIKKLLRGQRLLRVNVSPKLVLDHVVLP